MFRKLTRINQLLPENECIDVLKKGLRGTLAVMGDEGYPYAVPMNYHYDEKTNKIYFHSGKNGHKMDAIRNCDKVSFSVIDEGEKLGDNWWLTFRSVIVFGRIKEVENWEDDVIFDISYKFTSDDKYIDDEIKKLRNITAVFELDIENMTGKRVNER